VKYTEDSVYTRIPITYIARNEDDDVGQIFVDKLEEILKDIYEHVKKKPMTDVDEESFHSAITCHIYSKALG